MDINEVPFDLKQAALMVFEYYWRHRENRDLGLMQKGTKTGAKIQPKSEKVGKKGVRKSMRKMRRNMKKIERTTRRSQQFSEFSFGKKVQNRWKSLPGSIPIHAGQVSTRSEPWRQMSDNC